MFFFSLQEIKVEQATLNVQQINIIRNLQTFNIEYLILKYEV